MPCVIPVRTKIIHNYESTPVVSRSFQSIFLTIDTATFIQFGFELLQANHT